MSWFSSLLRALGCTVIEDGLPGRTASPLVTSLPEAHLDGHLGLRMALATHGPIDRLIIMLGTNDMQFKYAKSVEAITAAISGLLSIAMDPGMQAQHGGFAITLICPPPILETGTFVPEMRHGAEKSEGFPAQLAALAKDWSIDFLDAGQHIGPSTVDGVHFDNESHQTLGLAIADDLRASLAS